MSASAIRSLAPRPDEPRSGQSSEDIPLRAKPPGFLDGLVQQGCEPIRFFTGEIRTASRRGGHRDYRYLKLLTWTSEEMQRS